MTQFASVALFRRNGQVTFRAPMKQIQENVTQARKAAARVWNGAIRAPDKLLKVIVMDAYDDGRRVTIHEKAFTSPSGRWVMTGMLATDAASQPHLAACLKELGIDPTDVRIEPVMPDTLEINGVIYRREI